MQSRVTFLLALRSVFRHVRRSAIAVGAVAFGVVAMLLAAGFIEDILHGMREANIETQLGHIQITRPKYLQEGLSAPFRYLMADESPERQIVERAEHVNVVSPRLSFFGLISLGETTLSYLADGIEPEREQNLSKQLKIVSGRNLDPNEPKSAILGRGLARNLGAKVGDKIVLVANTERGGVNAVEVVVRGTFSTFTKSYDDVAVRLPLQTAQQLLRVKGVHRWVLLLDHTENTGMVATVLKQQLESSKFEVVPWTQLADFYTKTVTLFKRQVNVMKLIIAAIIILSITNTMMMSVMERTGEIGTSMALGENRKQVLASFLAEGFVLGATGAVVGVAVGMLLAFAVSAIGIPMPPPPGSTEGFTAGIRITPALTIQALLLAAATALIASVYPAWKASRMIIVDALRHNR
jgi:putative ABC transport system permease protein